jgi:hypothetical protein
MMPKFNAKIKIKLNLENFKYLNYNKMGKCNIPISNTSKYYSLWCTQRDKLRHNVPLRYMAIDNQFDFTSYRRNENYTIVLICIIHQHNCTYEKCQWNIET